MTAWFKVAGAWLKEKSLWLVLGLVLLLALLAAVLHNERAKRAAAEARAGLERAISDAAAARRIAVARARARADDARAAADAKKAAADKVIDEQAKRTDVALSQDDPESEFNRHL